MSNRTDGKGDIIARAEPFPVRDERDGKSHATTEGTCETCGDERLVLDYLSTEIPGTPIEIIAAFKRLALRPRPAAQDEDECDTEDTHF
jgi:hypothetical protein